VVAVDLQAMRQALANDPTEEAFWYLVQDESDYSFVGVNVTVGVWHQAAQAAINARKSDLGLTAPDD
jgi:hypothetical protein